MDEGYWPGRARGHDLGDFLPANTWRTHDQCKMQQGWGGEKTSEYYFSFNTRASRPLPLRHICLFGRRPPRARIKRVRMALLPPRAACAAREPLIIDHQSSAAASLGDWFAYSKVWRSQGLGAFFSHEPVGGSRPAWSAGLKMRALQEGSLGQSFWGLQSPPWW